MHSSSNSRHGCRPLTRIAERHSRVDAAEATAKHAVHRRFGFDPDASVRFVLEQALPLRGRVLDIGTGKGRFVIPMARHLAHVTTVDINAQEQRHAWLEAVHAGVADRLRPAGSPIGERA